MSKKKRLIIISLLVALAVLIEVVETVVFLPRIIDLTDTLFSQYVLSNPKEERYEYSYEYDWNTNGEIFMQYGKHRDNTYAAVAYYWDGEENSMAIDIPDKLLEGNIVSVGEFAREAPCAFLVMVPEEYLLGLAGEGTELSNLLLGYYSRAEMQNIGEEVKTLVFEIRVGANVSRILFTDFFYATLDENSKEITPILRIHCNFVSDSQQTVEVMESPDVFLDFWVPAYN